MNNKRKKIFHKAKKSILVKVLIFIIIAFPVYNVFLLKFHHEFRVSVNRVIEKDKREFFVDDPEAINEYMRWEDKNIVKGFEYPLPDSMSEQEKSLQHVLNIMTVMAELYSERELINKHIPESPESIRDLFFQNNYRGSCYNDAILLSTLLQKESYYARVIGLNGNDGLGGTGHNTVEVWIDSLDKWIALDPQNNVCFKNTEGEFLSVIKLREAVLGSDNEKEFLNSIEVVQFIDNNHLSKYVYKLYKPLIEDLSFYSNNDFYTESRTSFVRKISDRIEKQFDVLGVYAIWSGRWLRSVLGTRITLYRFIDDYNNESYNPEGWYYSYLIFFWIWNISVFIIIIIFVTFTVKRFLLKQRN